MRKNGAILLFVSAISACQVDVSGTDLTANHLHRVSRVVARLSFEECEKTHSLSDVFDVAQAKEIITLETRRGLEIGDFWGRPYRFERCMTEYAVTIRLVSNGHNGVFENGKGDDILVEIFVPKTGKATSIITIKEKKTQIP